MNTKPPEMISVVRSRWTAKDEATLQELTERKQRIDSENREPVSVLVHLSCPIDTAAQVGEVVVDWLIENATQLRVLLEPFDNAAR